MSWLSATYVSAESLTQAAHQRAVAAGRALEAARASRAETAEPVASERSTPQSAAPSEAAPARRDASPVGPDAAIRRILEQGIASASPQAALARAERAPRTDEGGDAASSTPEPNAAAERTPTSTQPEALTPEQEAVVAELKARDREVRAHEQAHATVGGQYAGAPSYEYQVGPDGVRYAVGGSVPIDVSPVPNDPQATVLKMEIVKAAALAPAEPSSADRRIAALADRQRMSAQAELIAMRGEALEPSGDGADADAPGADEVGGGVISFGAAVQSATQATATTGYENARRATAA